MVRCDNQRVCWRACLAWLCCLHGLLELTKLHFLHRFGVLGTQGNSPARNGDACRSRWQLEQSALARFVESDVDRLDFDTNFDAKQGDEGKKSGVRRALRLVGGVDISFVGDDSNEDSSKAEEACAALVVCSWPDMNIVYEQYEIVKLTHPYIPGYLAFREVRVRACRCIRR
jgi:hypothetical protein